MSSSVLTSLQENWEMARKKQAQPTAPEPEPVPAPVEHPEPEQEEEPRYVAECSCEWVGMKILGQLSEDLERDVARLKEIMHMHPIRPHLHEGGGSGFTYPHNYEWRCEHDELISEFARLWWTRAGDIIIEQWGHRMRVHPAKDWRKQPEPPKWP